jgi:hypothetical protein
LRQPYQFFRRLEKARFAQARAEAATAFAYRTKRHFDGIDRAGKFRCARGVLR